MATSRRGDEEADSVDNWTWRERESELSREKIEMRCKDLNGWTGYQCQTPALYIWAGNVAM